MPGTLNVGGHNIITHSGTSGAGTVDADNIDTVNIGNNALVVDSSGNVGINEATSIAQLHVRSSGSPNPAIFVTNTNADITWGTSEHFQMGEWDGTTFTERMRINSSGNLLVGTTTSGVSNSFSTSIEASGVNNSRIYVNHSSSGSSNSSLFMGFGYGGNTIGSITQASTTSTAFNTTSDYRLKENITEITDGITRVKQLNPARFNFIADPNRTVDGFIAHQVSDVVPEAITGEKDAVDDDGNPEYQGIDQSKLVPLLTAALQESIALIESQQSQIDTLTAKTQEQDLTIASLISRIEALENA